VSRPSVDQPLREILLKKVEIKGRLGKRNEFAAHSHFSRRSKAETRRLFGEI
jgi:hypothetical protein